MKLRRATQAIEAPPPPRVRLNLGVIGHRKDNPVFAANCARIARALNEIFDAIAAFLDTVPTSGVQCAMAPVRLHSMLADGADQLAAEAALARGWELVAPLPFGRALNLAINARPASAAEARVLLAGDDTVDKELLKRAQAIRSLCKTARVFELGDADETIAAQYLAMLEAPGDITAAQRYSAHASERVALAARVLIEQSDIIIGMWDGASQAFVGGTGHTIAAALDAGAPVVLIDANAPENWRILRTPESLAHPGDAGNEEREAMLGTLVKDALRPDGAGFDALASQVWRRRSNPLFHAYRRVESLFAGGPGPLRSLRETYETPDAIGGGSGAAALAALTALPGADAEYVRMIETSVLRRFAWADGISTHFSDLYRGGMVASFMASGLAIVAGVTYLPFGSSDTKWMFALAEFLLLASILVVTALGRRLNWHARWFETRRVAEYFRHSPILLALGAARAPGRWPKGTKTSWPEWYARQGLREIGLPRIAVSQAFLRAALRDLLDEHVTRQQNYHVAKAKRLTNVHHNLDRLSGLLFQLAVVSVAIYLVLRAGAAIQLIPKAVPHNFSLLFTFLGVLFPTFGGTIAGIRFFGDFERFAAISEVTAEKLGAVHQRALLLLSAPDSALDYGSVTDLAHVADDIVVTEIENWQAVFGGKHITVPA
jgi:hypothetical protein